MTTPPSTFGISDTLPSFARGIGISVLLGASVFLGSVLAGAILYWQVRRHERIA